MKQNTTHKEIHEQQKYERLTAKYRSNLCGLQFCTKKLACGAQACSVAAFLDTADA